MPGTEGTPVYGAAWGKPIHEEVTCPSGSICLVKTQLQPIDLVSDEDPGAHGPDILGGIVRDKIKEAAQIVGVSKKVEETGADLIDDAISKMASGSGMRSMIDNILIKYVVLPKLEWRPENPEDAVIGAFYVDTVPFPDKMFLFDRAMSGIREARQFPDEVERDLESLESVEDVPLPTEPAAESGAELHDILSGSSGDAVRSDSGDGVEGRHRARQAENPSKSGNAAAEDESGDGPLDGDEVAKRQG